MTRVRAAAVAIVATVGAASVAHGVTLSCDAISAFPGGVATVQIVLERSADEPVAATQNDLQFDPAKFIPQADLCTLNPAIVTKELATSVVDGNAVRAIVVGLHNVALIPAGNLYTCPFQVAADTPLASYMLINTNATVSAPDGTKLPAMTKNCVVSVVPAPTATATPRCRVDADCPPGEVCVDGTCVAATPTPTPNGFCNNDNDCPPGEVCVDHRCVTPTPIGYCTTDDDCPSGEVCVNNHCVTPTPGTTPTPKKGSGSSGCNCEIDPGAPASRASDVLAALLPAFVVLLRWRSRRPSR